jgi:molybdopterin-guanine dinucleotide biosynthesis protein A
MSEAAWDAIVLAGGRATRLGGASKADVVVDGHSLLDRTLDAVAGAGRVVVVGDVDAPGAIVVQEQPRFAGPAAAVGAGLAEVTSDWVLIAACDHPFVAEAVQPLLSARAENGTADGTANGPADGAVAVDGDGRRQHLLCVVSTPALHAAVAAQPTLTDLAVHRLLAPLDLVEIALPPRATEDVDTWHDREVAEGRSDA